MKGSGSIMEISVTFYSYFKDLAGCSQLSAELPPGSTVGDLIHSVAARCPRLAEMEKSILVAVGVEYQDRAYLLKEGDKVSMFPPVQGG